MCSAPPTTCIKANSTLASIGEQPTCSKRANGPSPERHCRRRSSRAASRTRRQLHYGEVSGEALPPKPAALPDPESILILLAALVPALLAYLAGGSLLLAVAQDHWCCKVALWLCSAAAVDSLIF